MVAVILTSFFKALTKLLKQPTFKKYLSTGISAVLVFIISIVILIMNFYLQRKNIKRIFANKQKFSKVTECKLLLNF